VRCGQCGAPLTPGDRFCGACGAPSAGCPSCGEPVTPGEAFAAAFAVLREQGTPYHLAHGLLDHARYLVSRGDGDAAAQAVDEARAIGRQLGCRPLLDRADATEQAQHQIRA
jgi:predicted amidophosphoribosyltransferase